MTSTQRLSQFTGRTILLLAALFVTQAWCTEARAVDLSGCWNGCWKSCVTGHKGPLRASFVRCNERQYDVTFSGRFFKIMPFRFNVVLDVIEDDGQNVKLSGSSYLGRMFGEFTYSATATQDEFHADYSSCKDNGYFQLSRCCTSCDAK